MKRNEFEINDVRLMTKLKLFTHLSLCTYICVVEGKVTVFTYKLNQSKLIKGIDFSYKVYHFKFNKGFFNKINPFKPKVYKSNMAQKLIEYGFR